MTSALDHPPPSKVANVKRTPLSHLSDALVRQGIKTAAIDEKNAAAKLVIHIAEVDVRRLYLEDGFSCIRAYCIGELELSADEAAKRIQVARAGLKCPGVFEVLAERRIHLTGMRILAPHLSPETADELLAAAAHKTTEVIERLVAERFPKADVPAHVVAISSAVPPLVADERAARHAEVTRLPAAEHAPGHVPAIARVEPLSSEAYAVQFTRSREQDERFRYLQDLLGHQAGRGDLAEVYARAVDELIAKLERRRFAACAKPRPGKHRSNRGSRHVSAEVMRAVWRRDGGQCTYVSASGRRCEARGDVEFDHEKEFARGGEATVDNIRLRCRGHNQQAAERTYGAGFMQRKRAEAAEAQARRRASQGSDVPPPEPPAGTDEHDVYLALRRLGYRDGESRRALALCADMPDASREDKFRLALKYFPQRCHQSTPFRAAPARLPGSPM